MATVRLSLNGISKSYNISRKEIIRRAKRLGIKARGRTLKGTALISLQDAEAIANYRK